MLSRVCVPTMRGLNLISFLFLTIVLTAEVRFQNSGIWVFVLEIKNFKHRLLTIAQRGLRQYQNNVSICHKSMYGGTTFSCSFCKLFSKSQMIDWNLIRLIIFLFLRPSRLSSQFAKISNTLFKFTPLKQNKFAKLRRCDSPTRLQFF